MRAATIKYVALRHDFDYFSVFTLMTKKLAFFKFGDFCQLFDFPFHEIGSKANALTFHEFTKHMLLEHSKCRNKGWGPRPSRLRPRLDTFATYARASITIKTF